jgi:hypothetical protein
VAEVWEIKVACRLLGRVPIRSTVKFTKEECEKVVKYLEDLRDSHSGIRNREGCSDLIWRFRNKINYIKTKERKER